MSRTELRAEGERLLGEARALRAAYPDGTRTVEIRLPHVDPFPDDAAAEEVREALNYLGDEMALVRDGRAGGLWVLDDEIAYTEHVLAGL